jgi:hypothetical protein
MRQKSGSEKQPTEEAIKDIRWAARPHCAAEKKTRVASREGLLPNEQTIIFRGRYLAGWRTSIETD